MFDQNATLRGGPFDQQHQFRGHAFRTAMVPVVPRSPIICVVT